jgi:hypothetical protein
MVWQPVQASFGRTWRVTWKLPGSYSSTSEMSWPISRRATPHAAQLHPPAGWCITMLRGRCSGNSRSRRASFGLASAATHFNVGDFGLDRIVGRWNWRKTSVHQLQLPFMIELLAGAPVAHALEIAQLQVELVDGQVRRL